MASSSTPSVYVLRLSGGKYYVGKSNQCRRRIEEHFSSRGASWTKKYRPLEVVEKHPAGANTELRVTLLKMAEYGIDNVRGASFCQEELTEETRGVIHGLIQSELDLCYACNKYGHFAHDCPYQTKYRGCQRCGRTSHKIEACYAKTTVDGRSIQFDDESSSDDESVCRRCGRDSHVESACYAKTTVDGYSIQSDDESSSDDEFVCRRCGRDSHVESDCYARTDVDGWRL